MDCADGINEIRVVEIEDWHIQPDRGSDMAGGGDTGRSVPEDETEEEEFVIEYNNAEEEEVGEFIIEYNNAEEENGGEFVIQYNNGDFQQGPAAGPAAEEWLWEEEQKQRRSKGKTSRKVPSHDKTFRTSGRLLEHKVDKHHDSVESGVKKETFVCNICPGKPRYRSQKGLHSHLRRDHPKGSPAKSPQPRRDHPKGSPAKSPQPRRDHPKGSPAKSPQPRRDHPKGSPAKSPQPRRDHPKGSPAKSPQPRRDHAKGSPAKSPQAKVHPKKSGLKVQRKSQQTKTFFCHLCQTTCRTQSVLDDHSRRHAKKTAVFPCVLCPQVFGKNGQARLLKHYQDEHQGVVPTCPVCEKTFKGVRGFLDHHGRHTVVTPFYCSQCKTYQKTERGLVLHLKLDALKNMKTQDTGNDAPQ